MELKEEIITKILKIAKDHPHLRVGQIVINAVSWTEYPAYSISDEELLAALIKFEEIARRVQEA